MLSFPLSWLDLIFPASSLPQQQRLHSSHMQYVHQRWPIHVPVAAGDRKRAVPQQDHPKYIILLVSTAKCMHVGGETFCMLKIFVLKGSREDS